MSDTQSSIFTDAARARAALEEIRWPDGVVCPHCRSRDKVISSYAKSHRPGLYRCGNCQSQFTVTVNTLFESSKISLEKWWLAAHLLSRSISINELHRRLGVTYKTAWFMAQRLRAGLQGKDPGAMSNSSAGNLAKVRDATDAHASNATETESDRARTVRLMTALIVQNGRPADKKKPGAAGNKRRATNSTRQAILEVACRQLARDGHEGLSLSAVAARAGVNRGTAYLHFKTRGQLVKATTDWVSEMLYEAVYGDGVQPQEPDAKMFDFPDYNDRLAAFALKNPELCRVWLLQVLASPDPSKDPFWREYQGSTARWAESEFAQSHVDPEVLTVIVLAGHFLWPVWVQARYGKKRMGQILARRFTNELLRLSMFGSMRAACYPDVRRRLEVAGLLDNPRRYPAMKGKAASPVGKN